MCKKIQNRQLIQILEFVFFSWSKTFRYAFVLVLWIMLTLVSTWHPKTGMFDVVRELWKLAEELGVVFHTNSILKIIVENKTAKAIVVNGNRIDSDLVLWCHHHHTETLLDQEHRAYSENIGIVVFCPSSLLFLRFWSKINMSHHALFFDTDFLPAC
jgi:phytoene desaturase